MRMRILSLFLNEKFKSLNEKHNKQLDPNVPNLMPGAVPGTFAVVFAWWFFKTTVYSVIYYAQHRIIQQGGPTRPPWC